LSANPENQVFGLVRNLSTASAATTLASSTPNLHILTADITSPSELHEAASAITAVVGSKGLDVFIENAGMSHDNPETAGLLPTDTDTKEKIESISAALHEAVEHNILGLMYATNAFLPLVKTGTQKKIIVLSSGLADIDFIRKAGVPYAIPYSVSKAALNVVVAKYAALLKDEGIKFLALSPGWVDTATKPRKSPKYPFCRREFLAFLIFVLEVS
jgi:NAD(P)-dependent dehydrogenase (short-subunit alcohol dehydrogenase family)